LIAFAECSCQGCLVVRQGDAFFASRALG